MISIPVISVLLEERKLLLAALEVTLSDPGLSQVSREKVKDLIAVCRKLEDDFSASLED